MIVWINGAFGVGKTTTAELLSRATDLRAFDPERVGYLLRAELADQPFGDFQELEPWVRLVPVVADEIARFTGRDLVAVHRICEANWADPSTPPSPRPTGGAGTHLGRGGRCT